MKVNSYFTFSTPLSLTAWKNMENNKKTVVMDQKIMVPFLQLRKWIRTNFSRCWQLSPFWYILCALACQTNGPVYVPSFSSWSANTTTICCCSWFLRDYAIWWLINSPAPSQQLETAGRTVPLSLAHISFPYCTDSPLDGAISSYLGREKDVPYIRTRTPLSVLAGKPKISQNTARKEEEYYLFFSQLLILDTHLTSPG